MYAHELIDDLTKFSKKILNRFKGENVEFEINLIKSSQLLIEKVPKFHINNDDSLSTLRDSLFGKNTPLFTKLITYTKLPYPICYFDYNLVVDPETPEIEKAPKGAMLCMQISEDLISVMIFVYFGSFKFWVMQPIRYLINLKTYNGFQNISIANNFPTASPSTNEEMEKGVKQDITELSILNAVMLLLNCKNIVQVEHAHSPKSSLNKKRIRNKKCPTLTYKTLHLQLPSSKEKNLSEKKLNEGIVKLHLCRGHFKEYTKEKPLFGKHTGLYWWDFHLRGQSKDGVVIKDYEITTKESHYEHSIQGLSAM